MVSGLRLSAGFHVSAFDDSDSPTSVLTRSGSSSRIERSDLVIVSRDEPVVYDYLAMRLHGLGTVELKFDERRNQDKRRTDDRRDPRRRFNAFGVQVVRRAGPITAR